MPQFLKEQKMRFDMSISETELLLKGYGLTTAEFFYRMPDFQNVLNTFVWQDYDVAPDHPKLFKFIDLEFVDCGQFLDLFAGELLYPPLPFASAGQNLSFYCI